MKNQNIVSRLVAGSRNLDRMKKEIHQVVSILVNFLATISPPSFERTFSLNPESYVTWKIEFSNIRHVVVECQVAVECFDIGNGVGFYSYSIGPDHLKATNVEMVYDSLPCLIEEMFESIPKIKQMAEPLLSAASKFED